MRRERCHSLTTAAGGPDKATPQLKFPITKRA